MIDLSAPIKAPTQCRFSGSITEGEIFKVWCRSSKWLACHTAFLSPSVENSLGWDKVTPWTIILQSLLMAKITHTWAIRLKVHFIILYEVLSLGGHLWESLVEWIDRFTCVKDEAFSQRPLTWVQSRLFMLMAAPQPWHMLDVKASPSFLSSWQ